MPKVEGLEIQPAIRALYDSRGVMTGDFLLKSGARSPIYWNLRNLRSFHEQRNTVVNTYIEMLDELKFDHIADIPTAATPLGTLVANKLEISQITPRQDVKDHGAKAQIDGVYNPGDIAVTLDDVATSGGSMIEGITVLRRGEVRVNDAVVLIDRQEGGEAALKAAGVNLHYAFTMREALESLADDPTIPDSDRRIFEERSKL